MSQVTTIHNNVQAAAYDPSTVDWKAVMEACKLVGAIELLSCLYPLAVYLAYAYAVTELSEKFLLFCVDHAIAYLQESNKEDF